MKRLLRQTRNYQAVEAKRGVRMTARDTRSTPRSRIVSLGAWQILAPMNDNSFDGSCVLELGIGTWRRQSRYLKGGENIAHPFHHALSSAKRWGGHAEEYLQIHNWFDASKAFLADFRHRALRHHAEGIFLAEQIFGKTIRISTGRDIPVRWVGEQHVKEDLGTIPAAADWLRAIQPQPWMLRRGKLPLEEADAD